METEIKAPLILAMEFDVQFVEGVTDHGKVDKVYLMEEITVFEVVFATAGRVLFAIVGVDEVEELVTFDENVKTLANPIDVIDVGFDEAAYNNGYRGGLFPIV